MFDLKSIFKSVRKLFTLKDMGIVTGLSLLFFATRLINLDKFPIFNDEGIYIHWAKVAWHDSSWRFISLTDGKQPLQTWGTIPFLKLFSTNMVLGGRLFAVSTGFFALIGLFILLYYLFGKKAAFWGALFYILTPYFIFYDRMALVDSGVNAFFIWIFLFSILLVQNLDLATALLFGLIGGIGLLAKSSVRIFVALAAFAPILAYQKHKKSLMWFIANFTFLYLVGAFISFIIYNVQRLSPYFQYVGIKNQTFIMTIPEFLKSPFAVFPKNMIDIGTFLLGESGAVIILLGLIGLFKLFQKNKTLFGYFFIWILIPTITIAALSRGLFARYIIFLPTLFVITAAYWFSQLKKMSVLYACLLFFLLSVGYFDYTLIADFKNIPFPPVDRGQYIESWPAGWGIKEIMDFARTKSTEKPVIILGEGNFGLVADTLDVYLKKDDRIQIIGYWPLGDKELFDHQKDLKDNYVYAVFSHRYEFPPNWPIKLIHQYDKPGGKAAIYLYELTK